MDCRNCVIVVFVVISSFVGLGSCLECYECSSLTVPGCGVTWEVTKNASQYLTKCEGNTTACRKLVSTDSHKGVTVVVRTCWNTTSDKSELTDDFLQCHDMSQGKACYCTKDEDDGEPCNGRQPLQAGWGLLSALVILLSLIPLRL